MRTQRIVFDKVMLSAAKRGKCDCCGRRFVRRRTFYQTLNPWNRGEHGFPKTREEIRTELAVEAAAWQGEPVTCGKAVCTLASGGAR